MSYPDNATASIAQFLFRESSGAMYIIPRRAFHNGAEYGDTVTLVQDLSGNGNDLTGTAVFDRKPFAVTDQETLNNIRDAQIIRDVDMTAPVGNLGAGCTVVRVDPGWHVEFDDLDINGNYQVTEDFSILIIIDRALTESEVRVIEEMGEKWGGATFNPLVNYANGEQGVYYAPWDISTLWQDDSRTVPVENYGDPVRVMDDLSPNGNHAVAPTSTARGTYGRMPATGVRNRLTNTDNVALTTVGSTIINNYAQSADGRWDISLITADSGVPITPLGTNSCYARRNDLSAPNEFAVSFEFKSAGLDRVSLVAARSDDLSLSQVGVTVSLTDGDVVSVLGDAVQAESELVEGGFWRVKLSMTRPALNSRFGIMPADSEVTEGDGIKGILYRRPQQEAGLAVTPYQRVGNQYDVSQKGVPDVCYIETDGIDDTYVTGILPWSEWDSSSTVIGFQYSGSVADGTTHIPIFEYGASPSESGVFAVIKSGGRIQEWVFRSVGSVDRLVYSGIRSDNDPHVLSMESDISLPELNWSVDQASGTNSESQGSGNYGNHALFLGSRGNAGNYAKGYFFGAITVVPQTPYHELNKQFIARKTGIEL